MDPERWQRVKHAFSAAVERAPGERAAPLAEACGDDAQVRQEVESLLHWHDAATSFLEPQTPAATGPGDEERRLEPGDRLGPYEITELLGVGGMGEVYRAHDTRLERSVAVKVLPRSGWTPERLRRFEEEARAASALNHPHIVAVHDLGQQDGICYLVTELLEGRTLGERIAQGRPSARKALEWAAQTARGLAAAHERGIVHRDVKPANLFVTSGGLVKILDFGLAKLGPPGETRSGVAPRTAPGMVFGTVGYMSPEQVRGEDLDFRSDQFSLGCVLYELLAGVCPFQRATVAHTLTAVLEEEPASLLEVNPRLPPPAAWIVERCLAKDPDDRYAATRDLARDLETVLARPSGLSGPAAATGPHPARRVALLGLVGLGVGAVVAAAWFRPWSPAPVPVVRYLTYSGSDGSPAASPDGSRVAFSSSRDGRRRIWLAQVATGVEVPLTEGPDDHPRFSPDGMSVLFARTEGSRLSLYRVPALGGEPRKLVGDALYGDFAPDGSRVCLVRQSASSEGFTSILATINADGSGWRELARFAGRAFVHPRWSPDGRTIAMAEASLQAGERTEVVLVDAETGVPRALPATTVDRSPEGLAWAGPRTLTYSQPQVALGAYTSSSSEVVVRDIRSSRTRAVLSVPLSARVVDVLGPGRLVFAGRSFRASLREVPLGRAADTRGRWLTRGSSTDRQPAYHPGGEWVAFSSNRGGNLDLWAVSRATGAVRRLTDDAAEDWDPAFTRDGKLLWSSNRTGVFEVWMANEDGTGPRQITHDGVDAENPVPTPDGAWILYASANPHSRGIMKTRPDGSQVALLVAGNFVLPEISPDGRHMAFVADLGTERAALRVARVADGAPVPFEAPMPPWIPAGNIDLGRCRWLPDGRGLAFIGQEPDGSYGVYVQEFLPASGQAGRRRLLDSKPDLAAESLGISPDGAYLTVAYWDELSSLMLAENVPGIQRPRAGR